MALDSSAETAGHRVPRMRKHQIFGPKQFFEAGSKKDFDSRILSTSCSQVGTVKKNFANHTLRHLVGFKFVVSNLVFKFEAFS